MLITGCLEDAEPTEAPAPEPVADVEIPQELILQPDSPVAIAAHANCGHMLYCNSGGRAVYCYYKRSSTGCSLQNVEDDFNSDCQYVCGHTACLNATIKPC